MEDIVKSQPDQNDETHMEIIEDPEPSFKAPSSARSERFPSKSNWFCYKQHLETAIYRETLRTTHY